MSSQYQSLSRCNESFLVFWSKLLDNPHLSQPSLSDSASYNLDLNPRPLGPQTLLSCWICSAAAQVILILRALETPPPSNTLTAPLKHLWLQSDILCQSWVSLGLLALGHWIGGNLAGVGKGGLTLDCVYHPLQILPIKHMDCVTASLANAWLQKPNKSPRLLSQSRPVNVDHAVRAQPQIKTKGEICSTSHCLLEFFAYFEWRSVDFIHSSAHIHVIWKGGISEEMYQFSMLRTPFSVCIRAIDRNPLSLPEGKKSQCFHTPLVKKGW